LKGSVFGFPATVAVLVLGFAATACSPSTPEDGFTITGIPAEFDGMGAVAYAFGSDMPEAEFFVVPGAQGVEMGTGTLVFSKIAGGKVSIPLWELLPEKRWTGNDALDLFVSIIPVADSVGDEPDPSAAVHCFKSVLFTDGKATRPFQDAVAPNDYFKQ